MSTPLVALMGSPNSGKTALFNALTGSRQKVANYPGVTVERKEGLVYLESGQAIRLLDLPGTYSLNPQSPDEEIALDVLLNRKRDVGNPHILINVADATNLERSLSLTIESRKLAKPVILALNMIDLAKRRGLELDLEVLSRELGVPVVATVAVKKKGIRELTREIDLLLSRCPAALTESTNVPWHPASGSEARERFNEVDRILKLAVKKNNAPSLWTDKIDRWILHPVLGHIILFSVLALMFQAVFTWAAPLMAGLELGVKALGGAVAGLIPAGALQSLIVDGVIAGLGAVLIFLPQILILFFFIILLEDSGYMARAAFLMDRSMGAVGLHGRAFIPLLCSFACAVPGIMATRTIPEKKDRLATILVAPLMTCSARLPVYTLLIAAFIPNSLIWGPFRMQGLVMLGLYLVSIPLAISVAYIFKKTLFKGKRPPFLMELPTYKLPSIRNVILGLMERALLFLKRAGKLIFICAIVLWLLASYPKPPENSTLPPIQHSFAAKIGQAIEPVVKPLGFDWRIATGLIPAFAAREVMVSALGTVFAIEAGDEVGTATTLREKLALAWGLPTALALLVWFIFSPQCLATFATIQRETNSWRWPIFMFCYLLTLAYIGAFLTFQIAIYLL